MFKLASETKTDPVLPAGAAAPWRDRCVEENLELFDQMRCGLWDEGTATLRMKMDLMSPNPNMMWAGEKMFPLRQNDQLETCTQTHALRAPVFHIH